jgi:putative polyhydroxyalkanoate system protein
MAAIDITRAHDKSIADAKQAIDKVARSLADKFDVDHEWQGNVLVFERSGVNGEIAVSKGKVRVQAELGFLLGALRGTIEREIEKYLDRELG